LHYFYYNLKIVIRCLEQIHSIGQDYSSDGILKFDGSFIEQQTEHRGNMTTRQFWAGRVLSVVSAIAIIISIPGIGIPGILGVQELAGLIVLGIATTVLAIGSLLIGVSSQEQPV
jgi:hypothetical protein